MNKEFFKNILSSETGSTAIEYGLIAALVVIAIISTLTSISNKFTGNMNTVSTTLTSAISN